ncbi:MAG: Endonuclease 4 [Chlamydiae bacterium]|nr:Endonuclease 4 [Chlamydiota bacterium]
MAKTPPEKLLIGAHTSTAGGVHNALLQGQEIGATTIQLFTSNQKQWKGREITPEIVDLWEETRKETGLKKIMSHDSYLINLGSPKKELLQKSLDTFRAEIERCHKLKIDFLNFHPGAATTSTTDECLDQIVHSLKKIEKLCAKGPTRLLLETTAGQGSSVGHEFEHLAFIIEELKGKIPIGVCIDTCHSFVAGYDLRTEEAVDKTLKEFDKVVGLKHLYAFHFNDSVKGLGSRVDRHRPLGEGEIGLKCFSVLMNDERTKHLPKYLETPGGLELWEKEIKLLKKLVA